MEIDIDWGSIFIQIDESLKSINDRINVLEKKFDNIENKLINIYTDNKNMEKTLTELQISSKNMDSHISFVENIYSVFKSPFRRFIRWYYRNDSDSEEQIRRLEYPSSSGGVTN
jgi:archaellum component FlaC